MNTRACTGLLAMFADRDALLGAVRGLRALGYARLEVYTPSALPAELDEALGYREDAWYRRVPFWVLAGGIIGGVGMLALQYYSAVIAYPIDVGGRPNASWPAFLAPALEMTLLFAALFGVVSMLIANRLPKLHHPLFAIDRFEHASVDGLFVFIAADEAAFEAERTRKQLRSFHATQIDEVPA